MALSQAAAFAEKTIGHGENATTEQDITNPGLNRAKYADPSGETMKALVWLGKNTVEVRKYMMTSRHTSSLISLRRGSQAQNCRRPRCNSESHGEYSLWK